MSLPISPAGRSYGCIQNVPDKRDKVMRFAAGKSLPPLAILSGWLGPVRDQGQEGSCVGHGWVSAADWLFRKYGRHHYATDLSPQFVYYKCREMDGTLPDDAGSQVRTGAKVFNQFGVCLESLAPYRPDTMNTAPSPVAMYNALFYKGGAYHSLPTLYDMKCCIADKCPYPFVDGIPVYESFESQAVADSGEVPMPEPGESLLGYHCTMTYGFYDHHKNLDGSYGAIKKRNSWGKDWGLKGDCWMPYAYVNQYLTDATILHLGKAWG